MLEKLNITHGHLSHYKSFTLATNYITSSVVDKMRDVIQMESLQRLHLINHRCGKEYPNVAMDQCTDFDVIRLASFCCNLNVLVLESFDEITNDLLGLLGSQHDKIRLLHLIKCSAFGQDSVNPSVLRDLPFQVYIDNKCSRFLKDLHGLMYPQYY